jgi:hypothetical protein
MHLDISRSEVHGSKLFTFFHRVFGMHGSGGCPSIWFDVSRQGVVREGCGVDMVACMRARWVGEFLRARMPVSVLSQCGDHKK